MTGRRPLILRLAMAWVGLWRPLVPESRHDDWCREWRAEIECQWIEGSADGAPSAGAQARLLARSLGAGWDAMAFRWQQARPIASFGVDLSHAWRGLRKRPGYSGFVVLVLALGMGAAAAVGTAVRSVLLAPLPYPEGDRLVMLWDENRELGVTRSGPTPANMLDWRDRSRSFDGMAAYYDGEPRTLGLEAGAEKVAVAQVTEDFFAVVGLAPAVGRVFTPEEVAAEAPVTVLGHGLWQRRFGGDAGVVGRGLDIDGVRHRVIGVLPASFAVPDDATALWLPWDFSRDYARLGHVPRDYRYLRVLARIRQGVSVAAAQADMDRVAAGLAAEHVVNTGWSVQLVRYKEELVGELRSPLLALAAAVTFVLLIATIDAAHLLVGRVSGRTGELAVRSALGASRWQLARLVGLEALLLSLAAAAAGVGLAALCLRGLLRFAPHGPTRLVDVRLDAGSVLQVMATAAIVSILLAAVATAACRSPRSLRRQHGRQRGGRSAAASARRRDPAGLVVVQIAAALVLLVMALLTLQSLRHVLAVDPGFERHQLLVARVFPDPARYDSAEKRLAYFDGLRQRLAALPGVRSVGASTGLPMNPYNNVPSTLFAAGERALEDGGPEADVFVVTAGFFETMGVRLVDGRFIDDRDRSEGEPVVVVNETLARSVWGDGAALGRQLRLRFGRDRDIDLRVIGVVRPVHSKGLKTPPRAEAFRPHNQVPYVTMNVVLRTSGADPLALAGAVRREILELDPTQPVHSITTASTLVDATVAGDRLAMWLLAVLAAMAIVLAGAGVYGVMAQAVSRRTREIGVRLSLGATPGGVLTAVLRRGASFFAVGSVVGIALSIAAGRLLAGLLYGIRPHDPFTLVAAAVGLGLAVLLACWRPAARAARIDPAAALRESG